MWVFTIWMEFSVVFSGQMELHFFPLRKRNRLNRIRIWSEFRMPLGRSLGTYHVNKKHGGWTSCRARLFIGRLGKLETSNQHPHFSHDVAQAEARWNVKEKHKYRPQNVIRFHLQGCSCVLKRPPPLPTNKDTHCNDKRFGNLPPSFRSLAFFLRSIIVKSLALCEWKNGTEIFGNSGKTFHDKNLRQNVAW